MSDIIHLLNDSIANQIAAGEVIQRPASVVKELVENAVDAGADAIHVLVKDAGRTLIQVADNGKGMSETDARMAFERHATSKITSADDLFSLRTLGFRGEALASIAAVAQVELKTSLRGEATGSQIEIAASQLESQQTIAGVEGSIFSVKNLFFNVPARRKFLKSNETEFKNIIVEFEHVALVNPQIAFTLSHNDLEVLNLPVANQKQRILNIFGKRIENQLLSLHAETSLVTVGGFIGTPDTARKRGALQYFFVNNRYMRHPYFHKAVMNAFEPFIPAGEMPNYFIYLTVEPSSIDVNIHPTKTEIKFENEQAVWQIITAAVKEAIGKSNSIPSIVFDQKDSFDIPAYHSERIPQNMESPKINLHQDYNPFRDSIKSSHTSGWEKLYQRTEPSLPDENAEPLLKSEEKKSNILSFKGKYLITVLKSGLALIDQRRAHIRVLFDSYMDRINSRRGVSQGLVFPEIITFTPSEAAVVPFVIDDLAYIGFDLADLGAGSWSVNGVPSGLENIDLIETLKILVGKVIETGCEVKEEISEAIALSLAQKAAISYGKILSEDEENRLLAELFASSSPNYTPDGKSIILILSEDEFSKRFR
ncbi:MAG: DNA mismatch repair endonuclease MutL [Dysgonamonadaceae bacterium]|jgi:DNA mismatch repair protein MutL|nr:DNA mismatch repair endonuclease MutL [Dysgonamonadaceae bacterium]